jgi:hypothetical protein
MNKRSKIVCKWLGYLALIVAMTAIGGDFGLIAGLVLVFLLH